MGPSAAAQSYHESQDSNMAHCLRARSSLRYTSSSKAIGAASPCRGPSLSKRVYPPFRSEYLGAISSKSFFTASGSTKYAAACLRAWRSPLLPRVIILSTSGFAALAFPAVVSILPCKTTDVTNPLRRAFLCPCVRPNFCRLIFQDDLLSSVIRMSVIRLPKAQVQGLELLFHFLERLLPEISDLHHVIFGPPGQLLDRVNPCPLEAVVGANRKIELLDGHLHQAILLF